MSDLLQLRDLVRLADKLDVDLMAAVQEKMVLNRAKYPAEQVRGVRASMTSTSATS